MPAVAMTGGENGAASSEHFATLFWQKKHATIAYCCVFWSFGMCVALLGPTLMDLGCKTGSSISTMGWVFFAQTLFILLGSATGAFLAKRFASNLVLFVATIMLAVTLAVIPLCYAVVLLALVLAVMGYFMGVIDTLANVSMISLYGKDVSPFLQALHFFYGLGAFVSPMIAEPFLAGKNCNSSMVLKVQSSNSESTTDNSEQQSTEIPASEIELKESHINYAFWIMALLQMPVIGIVFTMLIRQLLFTKGENLNDTGRQREDYEVMDKAGLKPEAEMVSETDDRPPVSNKQALTLTLLTALLLFLFDGLQAAYGGYVFSYARKSDDDFSSKKSAYLNACFWGTFAFGRLISIALATKLTPEFMLLCNICGCVFSMVLMLCFPHNHTALYVGTCIFGTFLSSIYPTAISLAEQYIHVTTTLASFIIVGAATGEMMFPVIVGHEFESAGPMSLLVTGVIMTLLSLFVYCGMCYVGNMILRRTGSAGMLSALSTFLTKPSSTAEDSGLVTQHVKYYSRMRSTMSESSFGGDAASEVGHELNNEELH